MQTSWEEASFNVYGLVEIKKGMNEPLVMLFDQAREMLGQLPKDDPRVGILEPLFA